MERILIILGFFTWLQARLAGSLAAWREALAVRRPLRPAPVRVEVSRPDQTWREPWRP